MAKRILLADDSVTIQKVVSLIFADEDYDLVTVGNGDETLSRVRELKPDLVMADIAMPGKNGYEVCEVIKKDPALKHIPVLLLAGTFEPLDENEATRVGADDHIIKPFESQELLDKVRNLLERPAVYPEEAPFEVETPMPPERPPVDIWEVGDFIGAEEVAGEKKEVEGWAIEDVWGKGPLEETKKEEVPKEEEFVELEFSKEEAPKEEELVELGFSEEELTPIEELEPLEEVEAKETFESAPEITPPVHEVPIPERPSVPEVKIPTAEVEAPIPERIEAKVREVVPEEAIPVTIPREMVEEIVLKVAREVVEEVAWEVIPDLAEELIKDEIKRVKEAIAKVR